MIKVFRKNQKRLLAVFGAFLMVVFIIQLAPKGMNSGAPERVAGTLFGKSVTQRQMAASHDEWVLLTHLTAKNPDDPNGNDIAFVSSPRVLGQAAQEINRNAATFYLLVREAQQQGIVAGTEEMHALTTNVLGPVPPDADPDLVNQAIGDALCVRTLLQRASNTLKVTQPARQWALAREDQQLTLNVVSFTAAQFLPKVAAPADADIRNQFDSFADQLPKQYGSKNDPLGFGYKIPDRVTLQYVGLKKDELKRAAQASKSDLDWSVAAFGEYSNNRDKYDAQQIPVATTQPSAAIKQALSAATRSLAASTLPSLNLPTTRMEVRKVDDIDQDFKLHMDLVLKDLYAAQAEKMEQQIVKQISDTMTSAFGAWHDSSTSSAPATMASDGYNSKQYILDLVGTIKTQYGVDLSYGFVQQSASADDLEKLEGIGKSRYYGQVPFAQYATEFAQPLMSDALKNSAYRTLALAVWQPSNPLQDEDGNIYIFRDTACEAAHSAKFADVKDQVVKDWKLAAAYDMASSAAHTLVTSAQKTTLADAAREAGGLALVTTVPFDPPDILSNNETSPQILPLNLTADSARRLARASQDLLSIPSDNNHPVSIAELYADATAAAIELVSASPGWDRQMQGLYETMVAQRRLETEIEPFQTMFCTYENTARRLDFKPDSSVKAQQ